MSYVAIYAYFDRERDHCSQLTENARGKIVKLYKMTRITKIPWEHFPYHWNFAHRIHLDGVDMLRIGPVRESFRDFFLWPLTNRKLIGENWYSFQICDLVVILIINIIPGTPFVHMVQL